MFVVLRRGVCPAGCVAFVPVQLKQKKRPKEREEAAGSEGRATGSERRASRKQDSGVWNLSSSENSDSSDSMSDLYPCQCRSSLITS